MAMPADLEERLNPRIVPGPRGPVVALERLTPRERALLGGDRLRPDEAPPGPLGDLVRETWRLWTSREIRVPLPRGELAFGRRTLVMGILNVTPDSFSDGGRFFDLPRALEHARAMVRDGADIIDVGGESTRPGARPVPAAEERRRVLPVVERLAAEGITVSVDTSKAAVAAPAFRAGAAILNDVRALRGDPRLAREAARAGAAVILMHMKGSPRTMQKNPRYGDVVAEILRFLRRALKNALSAGIERDKILVDPGIGFGKRPEHNVEILRRLEELRSLGRPLVVGTSRKSFIGHYLGRPPDERLHGTAATVSVSILRGADVVRVHDVRAMSDVARMTDLLR
jgi:dihydropteroate synthase